MSKFNVGADFASPAKVYLEHKQLGVVRTADGTPGWLLLKSNKHPDLVRLENKAKQEGIVRENQRRRGVVEDVTTEALEGKSLEYLMTALVDWGMGEKDKAKGGHLVNLAGQAIKAPCNDENKREVLSDPAWSFLRECLDRAVLTDAVFMPNSKLHSLNSPSESSSLES